MHGSHGSWTLTNANQVALSSSRWRARPEVDVVWVLRDSADALATHDNRPLLKRTWRPTKWTPTAGVNVKTVSQLVDMWILHVSVGGGVGAGIVAAAMETNSGLVALPYHAVWFIMCAMVKTWYSRWHVGYGRSSQNGNPCNGHMRHMKPYSRIDDHPPISRI